jgi:hypothetical protein
VEGVKIYSELSLALIPCHSNCLRPRDEPLVPDRKVDLVSKMERSWPLTSQLNATLLSSAPSLPVPDCLNKMEPHPFSETSSQVPALAMKTFYNDGNFCICAKQYGSH